MPQLNHTGPLGQGPKTGRMLGRCHKTKDDLQKQAKLGVGVGLKKHSEEEKNKNGERKRLRYNE
ncbi:MAG: DUF5320 domain-containing protein [Bacteroidales bacterium]